jgi:hypothetical protein
MCATIAPVRPRRNWACASSFVPAVVVIWLLSLTIVGAPVAAWLTVRCAFLAQVTMLEGRSGRGALRRSGGLVRLPGAAHDESHDHEEVYPQVRA